MNYRVTQPNFSRGELGPQLSGRFDADSWQSSVQQARNVVILKYGGLTKRPGMRFVAEVFDDSEDTRLIPFQFSTSQTYALEFGQGYMAPIALGGRVLRTHLAITGITKSTQATITAAFHGYAVGDRVWLTGIEGGLGDFLNSRFFTVIGIVDDNNFKIDADTSLLPDFTGAAGGITRTEAADPDPTPPVVTSPVPPALPPDTGGGGAGGFERGSNGTFL